MRGARGESWQNLDAALRVGLRGLAGGSSLARLLASRRGVPNIARMPRLTLKQILAWADAHLRRTGDWPNSESGPVTGAPGESWQNVDAALRVGMRGLAGSSSLADLLARRRGRRFHSLKADLDVKQILAWADGHHRRTGDWPTVYSGAVSIAPHESWLGIDRALRQGLRDLSGGSSLAKLLARRRGRRNQGELPPLKIGQIVQWARAHRVRSGTWPTADSGPVAGSPGEKWLNINAALRFGIRGLPGGESLAKLLARCCGVETGAGRQPRVTIWRILAWAGAHQGRTGEWPTRGSGPVEEARGGTRASGFPSSATWSAIDHALVHGRRGLPGGSSLARLLASHGRRRWRARKPALKVRQILEWADDHRRRSGRWPTRCSGPVLAAPGESWRGVEAALYVGQRGLPGGSSLSRLLAKHRGCAPRSREGSTRMVRARDGERMLVSPGRRQLQEHQ